MNDMELLRRAYERENDPRDRRPPSIRSWEYYTIGASRKDIQRLLEEGMLVIAMKSSTLTKYKLSEKGRHVPDGIAKRYISKLERLIERQRMYIQKLESQIGGERYGD